MVSLKKKEFQPGRGYTKEDWNAVDFPEMTDEELAEFRPAEEVLPPEFLANLRNHRGPQKEPTKVAVSIRLSQDVLAYYKGHGEKWQSRIDADCARSLRASDSDSGQCLRSHLLSAYRPFLAPANPRCSLCCCATSVRLRPSITTASIPA
jgi:uncharacterized protein (DUF4415 family)